MGLVGARLFRVGFFFFCLFSFFLTNRFGLVSAVEATVVVGHACTLEPTIVWLRKQPYPVTMRRGGFWAQAWRSALGMRPQRCLTVSVHGRASSLKIQAMN